MYSLTLFNSAKYIYRLITLANGKQIVMHEQEKSFATQWDFQRFAFVTILIGLNLVPFFLLFVHLSVRQSVRPSTHLLARPSVRPVAALSLIENEFSRDYSCVHHHHQDICKTTSSSVLKPEY